MAKRINLRDNLLNYNITASGYRQYDIVASKVTEAEFKRLVKRANDRLYKLEKANLTDKSREYREVEHYAIGDPQGKGSIYNVNANRGTIRFTSSLKGLTRTQKSYLINTVRNFMNAQTSTISGTKKAFKQSYQTFMQNYGSKLGMTPEQYETIWSVYRDMVEKDKLGNKGYNAFMELVKSTNLYELKPSQIRETLQYIDNSDSQSVAGIVADVLDSVQMEHANYNLINLK